MFCLNCMIGFQDNELPDRVAARYQELPSPAFSRSYTLQADWDLGVVDERGQQANLLNRRLVRGCGWSGPTANAATTPRTTGRPA